MFSLRYILRNNEWLVIKALFLKVFFTFGHFQKVDLTQSVISECMDDEACRWLQVVVGAHSMQVMANPS